MPPRRVRAANEPRSALLLDVRVETIEVVSELAPELRLRWGAALDPVADVEDHEPVVPVRHVGEPVAHVDVVQHARRRTVGLPARNLARILRVADVDHAQRAGRVVGEIDVCAVLRLRVHVRRVHATGHRLRELGDRLWVRRVLEREDDDAVAPARRALARQHAPLPVGGRHHVVHHTRVDDDRVGDARVVRIRDVERIHAVADRRQVRVLAVGVRPELRGRQLRERHAAEDSRGALHVARPRPNHRLRGRTA